MNKIRMLNDEIINQIAAGEIIERPSSALKEIIENSIDASARNIDVFLKNSGKSKIIVEDDGEGLSKEDLQMCIKRHATSKLEDVNLFNIKSYGFRGEALPSIAAVSDFSIESKGFGISVKFSEESEIYPSPVQGTKVCVENLFSFFPVRLKFLKSDSSEFLSCLNIVENFVLARPNINFSLSTAEKTILSSRNSSIEERISKIFGKEVFKNALYFEESDNKIRVYGYLFHPLENRYSQNFQRIFVNNRYVKDKIVSAAIKNAYRDLIPLGRYAIALIFIEIDPLYVDVNISPTKSEVRFRNSSEIQQFLTNIISNNLKKFDKVAINFDIPAFLEEKKSEKVIDFFENKTAFNKSNFNKFAMPELSENLANPSVIDNSNLAIAPQIFDQPIPAFGTAVCQIFNSYIIAEKDDELIIIDQHAVHEKIKQTELLKRINPNNKQYLLRPEIIDLTTKQLHPATEMLPILRDCGFSIEFINDSLIMSAIPTILNNIEAKNFVIDILSSNELLTDNISTIDIIKKKIADKACHNSIRFGRKLSIPEMNEIIKQMEETESINQCNHHRPSFIVISKPQLEKMFERT
ncbi:MAG: DNA mismatch repair endonuclease MutL [Holosporales bacterium]|jgi:DNA mismatch repair protein MutL|nr:DNA mismatch repair endonuclease MutL [Holosporales bacterium]